MSQYITKNKLTRVQLQELIDEKDSLISSMQIENRIMHKVLKYMPGYVFWKNREGKYLGCNKNNILNLNLESPDEFIGKSNADLFDAQLAATLNERDQEIYDSGKEQAIEESVMNANSNGDPTIYLTRKIPVYDRNNQPIGLIGVSFDITERKNMENAIRIAKEKAEASDQAKSQFIAMMNHELNTPLASIIGLIDFIRQGSVSADEEKNILKTIKNCSRHLLDLVNEVLDFSKLEKGKSGVKKTFVDLSAILNEAYNLLHMAAKNKGLDLRIHLNHQINKTILTDSRILLQILINLVNNAIKFSEKGHVTLEVTVIDMKSHSIKLELAVIDTGCGIPENKFDVIFEPFEQLGDTYTRQSSRYGTGLGLAIVKKLAAQLDLTIKVVSTLGQGSTFFVTGEFEMGDEIPLSDPSLPVSDNKPLRKKISPKKSRLMIAAKKSRVLLVEDDPVIQYIHKKMLEECECQVEIFSHGRDAIQMLDQHDIAFVDLSLPDISGYDVIRSMREQNPQSQTPIVALTVHTGSKEKEMCLHAGANDFASKPITRTRLRKLLFRYVVRRKVR